jgi:hypothetical protein
LNNRTNVQSGLASGECIAFTICITQAAAIAFHTTSLTDRQSTLFLLVDESFASSFKMPVYRSVGIKATLSTASLEESLDKHFLSTAIAAHKQESGSSAGRPAAWRDLQERPLYEKRDRYGVIQFLGPHEDMPFFAVEAAENLHVSGSLQSQAIEVSAARSSRRHPNNSPTKDRDIPCEVQDQIESSQDQHLRSDANSVMDDTPTKTLAARQRSEKADAKQVSTSAPKKEEELRTTKESALLLRVDIQEQKDKLPRWPRAVNSNAVPELKVEILLHGELADVVFLNKSRNAVQLHDDTMLIFHGTRVAPQLERPWVYRANQNDRQGEVTSAQRWLTYQESLREEARQRGIDKYGAPPPSAKFLQALSMLDLPDHLKHHMHLSIIDVVVTTGKGKKFR